MKHTCIRRTSRWAIWWMALLIGGCSDGLSPQSFAQYIQDPENGLVATNSMENAEYELRYFPAEFLALTDFNTAKKIDTAAFANEMAEYKNYLHFQFSIKPKNNKKLLDWLAAARPDMEVNALVKHLSFELNPGFYGHYGKDSLPCTFYHLQSTGQLDNGLRYLVAFPKLDGNGELNFSHDIIFNFSDTLLKTKPAKLIISQESLNKIPNLKL